jgi:lipopolysaccharide/colanic/teichoic acid biosynthesis glycosyltransferase
MPEPASITLFSTGCLGLAVRTLRRKYRSVKPYADWAAALALTVLLSPVVLVCAVLIKLTSRGPVFYVQERVGQGGRVFRMYKLRTMRDGAESDTGPVWSDGEGDARVTPVGRFLRRSHLDEVPQLMNVLKGEMSLVGPRPERPHFVNQFEGTIPDYGKRLEVKPGITGLAQLRVGYDRTVDDVRRKVLWDRTYIRRMCWWVDFLIVAGTLSKALGLGRTQEQGRTRAAAGASGLGVGS